MIDLQQYPKVHEKLKVFIKSLLETWIKDAVGEDPTELTDEHIDLATNTVVESNPRVLYDFLDEEGVFLQPVTLTAVGGSWGYKVDVDGVEFTEEVSKSSRREIEDDGFNHALKILEERL